MQQDVRAVRDVFRMRELAWGMTDPANARNEDHAHWSKPRHVLSVMSGAGRHQFCRQTEFTRGFADQRSNLRVGRRGNVDVDLFESNLVRLAVAICCASARIFS